MNNVDRLKKNAEYQRHWRAANKEKAAEWTRAWVEKNADAVKAGQHAYYQANKEKIKASASQRYQQKREELKAYAAQYRANNKEAVNRTKMACRSARPEQYRAMDAAFKARYYVENRDKLLAKSRANHYSKHDKRLAQKRAWARKFPEKGASYQARRRAYVLRATPAWANQFFIEEAYRLARMRTQMTGLPWEVDHDLPLVSPLVCGLHVAENMRVIPRMENRSKGNRLTVEDLK